MVETPPEISFASEEHYSPPESPFPYEKGPAGLPVRIALSETTWHRIVRQTAQAVETEVCGVLVGKPFRDSQGFYVIVEGAIPGKFADSRFQKVIFTPAAWQYIHKRLDEEYPDLRIVGWYHTHPGFGTSLSEEDRFVCKNFFPNPWEVALVLDPVNRKGCFFALSGEAISKVEKVCISGQWSELKCEIPVLEPAEETVAGPDDLRRLLEAVSRIGEGVDRAATRLERFLLVMTIIVIVGICIGSAALIFAISLLGTLD